MSKAAIKMSTAATAATAKKTATAKTTSKTGVDYRLMAPSICLVSKVYGLRTNNKFAMSFDTEGTVSIAKLLKDPPRLSSERLTLSSSGST
jgi:hypothetical protein